MDAVPGLMAGWIVNEHGTPVADATVRGSIWTPNRSGRGCRFPQPYGFGEVEGHRFRFTVPSWAPEPPEPETLFSVAAPGHVAIGVACTPAEWARLRRGERLPDRTLVLRVAARLDGIVLADGAGVAEARVRLVSARGVHRYVWSREDGTFSMDGIDPDWKPRLAAGWKGRERSVDLDGRLRRGVTTYVAVTLDPR